MDCCDPGYDEMAITEPVVDSAPALAPADTAPVTWATVGPGTDDEALALTTLALGEIPGSGTVDAWAPGLEVFGEYPTPDPNVVEVGIQ
jgi:hypothetical protein